MDSTVKIIVEESGSDSNLQAESYTTSVDDDVSYIIALEVCLSKLKGSMKVTWIRWDIESEILPIRLVTLAMKQWV